MRACPVPELRKPRVDASAIQFDTRDRQASCRSGPFRGYAVQLRNGLPERTRHYEYRGTGYCMSEAEAAWWLTEMRHA